MKRMRDDARVLSPIEELPSDMLQCIREARGTTPFTPVLRVNLQRVCTRFYLDDPGLILPLRLEPYRNALPVSHPSFHQFLYNVIVSNVFVKHRVLQVVDLTRPPPSVAGDVERHLHAQYKDAPFALGIQLKIPRDKGEFVVAAYLIALLDPMVRCKEVSRTKLVPDSNGLYFRPSFLRPPPFKGALVWKYQCFAQFEDGRMYRDVDIKKWCLFDLLRFEKDPDCGNLVCVGTDEEDEEEEDYPYDCPCL